jgi:hypothetical protein
MSPDTEALLGSARRFRCLIFGASAGEILTGGCICHEGFSSRSHARSHERPKSW